jgi:FKBP-type peptidyl-prolyl cis-trans isomerase FklB
MAMRYLFPPIVLGILVPAPKSDSKSPTRKCSDKLLKKNARTKGVIVLPGIQYRIIKSGARSGASPKSGDKVLLNYEGRLPSGTVFDSSYQRGRPSSFLVREVIPGWQVVLKLMRPGDVWEVVIPSEMAYGSDVSGPIPPDSVLIFKIALIEIEVDLSLSSV